MGVQTFLLKRQDVFPVGTEISIYAQGAHPNHPDGSITAKALQTKKDEGAGVEFTELDPGNYVCAAVVGGVLRKVRVSAGKLGGNLKPPAAFPGHRAN